MLNSSSNFLSKCFGHFYRSMLMLVKHRPWHLPFYTQTPLLTALVCHILAYLASSLFAYHFKFVSKLLTWNSSSLTCVKLRQVHLILFHGKRPTCYRKRDSSCKGQSSFGQEVCLAKFWSDWLLATALLLQHWCTDEWINEFNCNMILALLRTEIALI